MQPKSLLIAVVLAALALSGCTNDAERIERGNEAASQGTPADNSQTDGDSIFDLRTGDCIKDSTELNGDVGSIERIPCGSTWKLAVLNSFVMTGPDDAYPGVSAFDVEFDARCDRNATTLFHPTRESWKIGDRTINCLIEASTLFAPQIGDCYSEELLSTSGVPCTSPHTFEAYAVADLPDGDYPGDFAIFDAIDDICLGQFEAYVGRDYETSELFVFPFAPTTGTWDLLSDRVVSCYLHTVDFDSLTDALRDSGR